LEISVNIFSISDIFIVYILLYIYGINSNLVAPDGIACVFEPP
jgi:hypothetical protein